MISACLAGELTRYDGQYKPLTEAWLDRLLIKGCLIKCCPEMEGGMPVPRPPAQLVGGDGEAVLTGRAKVMDIKGEDVTGPFVRGAERSLSIVQQNSIRLALLKEKSPSCGVRQIYDGTFENRLVHGSGVASALLRKNGVYIFSENEIHKFISWINQNFPTDYL